MCAAEKLWNKCRGPRQVRYRQAYRETRRAFDKAVQKAKRAHWWSVQEKLLEDSTTNKRDFWKEIGRLGIAKDRAPRIPMEVVLEDGTLARQRSLVYAWLLPLTSGPKPERGHWPALFPPSQWII